mmetsp:Transcript_129076/g.288505  ORF Transcript_129076/g.288505 Transcript_129076/m.288505 type:complete len:170 (+) Transcript_129076:82-591(+)
MSSQGRAAMAMAAAMAALVLLGSGGAFVPQTPVSTSVRAAPSSALRGQALAGAAELEGSDGAAPAQHALAFGAMLGLLLSVAVASPVYAEASAELNREYNRRVEAADDRQPKDKSPRKYLIQDKEKLGKVPDGASSLESKLASFEIKAKPIDFVDGGKNPVTGEQRGEE